MKARLSKSRISQKGIVGSNPTSSAKKMIDKNLFYNLETELLKPEVRASVEQLNDLIADDFIEFTASGEVHDKATILKVLPTRAGKEQFIVKNFSARELADDVVLVTYEVDKEFEGVHTRSLRSSIWMKNKSDKWQGYFHQGTLLK